MRDGSSDGSSVSGPRGRILGWIVSHPIQCGCFLVLLMMLGTCALLDEQADRRLEGVLASIRAAGEPVTIEDLVAGLPDIPDEENMAVRLEEHAAAMVAVKIPEEQLAMMPFIGKGKLPPTGRKLTEPQLEVVHWYLGEVSEALGGAHEALELEGGCVERHWKTPALDTQMSELTSFRHVANTLALEATAAADRGDAPRACQVLGDILKMDQALECHKTLIDLLVRVAIRAGAIDQLERTINLCSPGEVDLRAMQVAVARHHGVGDFKDALITERVLILNTMEWTFSGEAGAGSAERGQLPGMLRYVPFVKTVSVTKGLKILNDLIASIDRPGADAIRKTRLAEQQTAELPRYCLLWTIVMPSYVRAAELWGRVAGSELAMEAALGCERYRLATGGWPETLADLVPTYLDAVPLDPFDDKPIRYRRIDEGIKVWSIGEDMTDDGGDVRRLIPTKGLERPNDWGWVLLNPELRGRPAEDGD